MVQELIPQGPSEHPRNELVVQSVGDHFFKNPEAYWFEYYRLDQCKRTHCAPPKRERHPTSGGLVPNWSLTAEPTMVSAGWFSRTKLGFLVRHGDIKIHRVIQWFKN